MGKRSSFERIEKDFYRTIDNRAVETLLPHIPKRSIIAEPCVGDGDLAHELECHGHDVPWQTDIRDGLDALEINDFGPIDLIVTNPPWSRKLLHPLIEHLSSKAPTWLLFDSDWAHTKQSAPFMRHCVKIVSVGRLIWIPGTTMSGKDNCAWYLFDANHNGPTEFVGRQMGE